MKIEMLIKIPGTRNGIRWPDAGTVIDLPGGEANDLITQGCASKAGALTKAAPTPKVENTAAPKPEKRG